ncbi:Flagellar hook-associated protein 2 [Alcanivorax sp. ALC70]|nr:Flagellar hook-associated protein 2 [Alcanivorax sp. ALC70]
MISGGAGGGEFNTLADLGITLEVDGTLEVDDEAVDDAVDNQLGALADFFTGTADNDGLAVRLDNTLAEMVDDGGTLDDATEGLETSIDTLQSQYTRTEERINSTLARYRTQFQKLDSMIAEMNSTSSYLTQQFDALNAQLGQ